MGTSASPPAQQRTFAEVVAAAKGGTSGRPGAERRGIGNGVSFAIGDGHGDHAGLAAIGGARARRNGPCQGEGRDARLGGAEARQHTALTREREEEIRDSDAMPRCRDRESYAPDELDPSVRHAASLGPPGLGPNVAPAREAARDEPLRGRSVEELLPALVRRIAWRGDRHRGTVRLELGAGSYAGTTLLVHADGGRIRVEVGGTDGPDLDRLRARIDARLRGHGLDVESVT